MSAAASFKFTGAKEMKSALQIILNKYPTKVKVTLRRIAERIMTKSKSTYVPVDSGTLRSTGHVEEGSTPGTISIMLVYGGPAADYALDQHENFFYHHEVGGPKYLERPMMLEVLGMAADIARTTQLGR